MSRIILYYDQIRAQFINEDALLPCIEWRQCTPDMLVILTTEQLQQVKFRFYNINFQND